MYIKCTMYTLSILCLVKYTTYTLSIPCIHQVNYTCIKYTSYKSNIQLLYGNIRNCQFFVQTIPPIAADFFITIFFLQKSHLF